MRTWRKLVFIEWEDAIHGHGWLEEGEIPEPCIAETIGFVLEETESHVVVAQTVAGEGFAQVLRIPRGMIRSLKKVSL